MSDYIVLFDENSQPYIAHWGKKKNHKYIAKIGLRYFYTQEELNAYNNRKRSREAYKYAKKENRVAQKAAKKANKANKEYTASVKRQQKAWAYLRDAKSTGNKSNVRRAEKLVKDAKRETSSASQKASTARFNANKAEQKKEAFKKDRDKYSTIGRAKNLIKNLFSKEKVSDIKVDDKKSEKTINRHKNDNVSDIGPKKNTEEPKNKKERAYKDAVEAYKKDPSDENGKKVDAAWSEFKKSPAFVLNEKKYDTPAKVGFDTTINNYTIGQQRRDRADRLERGHVSEYPLTRLVSNELNQYEERSKKIHKEIIELENQAHRGEITSREYADRTMMYDAELDRIEDEMTKIYREKIG